VKGFSTTSILIKLIGASYFGVNSFLQGETMSVILYGAFNIGQHLLFMIQFLTFTKQNIFIWYCFIPLIPLFTGYFLPWSLVYTNSIKPICQVLSHVPQLLVSWRLKSTDGVSLPSQHLNIFGGVCGLFMCFILGYQSYTTPLVYLNSILQAVSIYVLCIHFDGIDYLLQSFKDSKHSIIEYLNQFNYFITTATTSNNKNENNNNYNNNSSSSSGDNNDNDNNNNSNHHHHEFNYHSSSSIKNNNNKFNNSGSNDNGNNDDNHGNGGDIENQKKFYLNKKLINKKKKKFKLNCIK
jgi:uncharacterized protein with PQ loop repeat